MNCMYIWFTIISLCTYMYATCRVFVTCCNVTCRKISVFAITNIVSRSLSNTLRVARNCNYVTRATTKYDHCHNNRLSCHSLSCQCCSKLSLKTEVNLEHSGLLWINRYKCLWGKCRRKGFEIKFLLIRGHECDSKKPLMSQILPITIVNVLTTATCTDNARHSDATVITRLIAAEWQHGGERSSKFGQQTGNASHNKTIVVTQT